MGIPANFTNGVNNRHRLDDTGMMPFPDPTTYYVWFDDFADFDASHWVVTEVDTDGDGAVANGTTSGLGGLLVLNVEADELDLTQIQWAGEESSAVIETFYPASGKRFFMKARFKVSDATDTGLVVGLAVTDTTLVAAVTDGIYFRKADTDATLQLVVEGDSTESTCDMTEMANDTFVTAAVYYDGVSTFKAYVDNVHVGTITTAANLPTEEVAVSAGINNGAEGAEALTIDYIFVAQER